MHSHKLYNDYNFNGKVASVICGGVRRCECQQLKLLSRISTEITQPNDPCMGGRIALCYHHSRLLRDFSYTLCLKKNIPDVFSYDSRKH